MSDIDTDDSDTTENLSEDFVSRPATSIKVGDIIDYAGIWGEVEEVRVVQHTYEYSEVHVYVRGHWHTIVGSDTVEVLPP